MLNLVTIDVDDREILEASYDALINKDTVEILTGEEEKNEILNLVINHLKVPYKATFSFQNLFLIKNPKGNYYIAQCLVDFGFPSSNRGLGQNPVQVYYYYTLGIAKISVDIGNTHLRPETKIDKWLPRFIDPDIDFESAEKFSDKYYLVSDNKEAVLKYFEKPFLDSMSAYNDLFLTVRENCMYISFESHLQAHQTAVLQKIFNAFNFLSKQ